MSLPGQETTLKHMITRTRPRRSPERASPLQGIVTAALDEMKAVNVKVLDVRGLTDIADTLIVASGNSDRHVRSIADRVIERVKNIATCLGNAMVAVRRLLVMSAKRIS